MKTIAIIDDEQLARDLVKEYLATHTDLQVVAECSNGFEGVKSITEHKPDLVILDIQMPKISGFEMLELLDEVPAVIFATAFDEYALKAFEANAVDYLLKPFSKERFDAAIMKWRSQRKAGAQDEKISALIQDARVQPDSLRRIVVREGRNIAMLSVDDITYIEAFDDYVKLFTKETFFLKKKTMGFYESSLDPEQFFRTHRSFIINLRQLTRIEKMEKNSYLAFLKDGEKIPVSRSSYARLKEKLGL
jgi:two-component system, LytTR family, response regulator